MRIRIAVPDAHVSPAVLNAALEASTRANQAMLRTGEAEPISQLIDKGKVKWKPEPFKDGEHFDLSSVVQKRGWGDCDDLAPGLAAELREKGIDPGAKAVVKRSGPNLWHAVTKLSDGRVLDPSVHAGMREYKALHGTSVVGMVDDGGIVGIRPWEGKWAARCDLPMVDAEASLCGLAICGSPLEALTEAVQAATIVGGASGAAYPDDIMRALAIQAATAGEDFGDTLAVVGEYIDGEELGSIFSKIARGLKSVVPAAANFIPIPGAGLAAQAAMHMIPGTKAHAQRQAAQQAQNATEPPPPGGVNITRSPNGAIVVRF